MRIALIDDAPAMRALFTRIASAVGHDVIALDEASAAKLCHAVRALAPDVVVVDGRYAAPLGWGEASEPPTIPLLRSLCEAVPLAEIAVVAALEESALVRNAALAGMTHVILRPLLRRGLVAVLETIASQRARRLG